MDRGGVFGWQKLLRFNGHFFAEAEVLPLSPGDLAILAEAAEADWRYVEPTIFGTLLTRALDPKERHRLGAEYTPREYVERVVRQTVDVPLRERWAPVQAHVAELRATGKKKNANVALKELRDYHTWMRGLRFLDPACGSGNFLYVCLHLVKRVELEVLRAIEEITGNPELGIEEVGPWQFHGIEVKPWAREIAELTLWIGYHQFWLENHKGVNPPEPVLKDTGTLELRDAVLAWDEIVEVPEKSRPDPTPRIPHLVTGKLVPDPDARLPYYEYRGARQAEWPRASFIVGNPPYMGQFRMRESFGHGYVDALRSVYPDVPDNADYVAYWWSRSADEVATESTFRAGLITTNTLTQKQNRVVVERAYTMGVNVLWAIADHPWVDEQGSAQVRVAMTVMGREAENAVLIAVNDSGMPVAERHPRRLNADLTAHSDIPAAAAVSLAANVGVCSPGLKLDGSGFIVSNEDAEALLLREAHNRAVLRPYLNGKDLNARPRGVWLIDFGLMSQREAQRYPVLYDRVRDRVKPERDAKPDAARRVNWWRLGRPRELLRQAVSELDRFIVTSETSKHRFVTFLPREVAPDNKLVCFALSNGFHLGILSSAIHVTWSIAAGGRLGVGNDPVYVKSSCFDPFPFPDPPKHLREEIGRVAERLDQHRKDAIARDERVTMTGMYNVVEKLRSGEALTPKERVVHEIAACGVLRDLHDELDRLVAQAYGWPWPMEREEVLERLVALHDERVAEEKRGIIRWLRPEYQVPRFGGGAAPDAEPALDLPEPADAKAAEPDAAKPWPADALSQLGAIKMYVSNAPATPSEVGVAFAGAPVALVARYLDTLAMVGEVRTLADGRYQAVTEPL
jgi:hypothetical protein